MILGQLLPIGSVIHSMLTEAQFQAQAGSGWVLADGRSVSGSVYATVTGASTVPDVRGAFLRAKNNGSSRNPDGDLSLGTYSADKYTSHSHTIAGWDTGGSSTITLKPQIVSGVNLVPVNGSTETSGGNETAPKSIIVNVFIRIN